MHKRRQSNEEFSSASGYNRKLSSTQTMDKGRSPVENEHILSRTLKFDRKIMNSRIAANDGSIANIIQEKVANLKHKFGELDNMRKRFIESRADALEESESKKATIQKTRGKSTEFDMDTYAFDLNKTHTELFNPRSNIQEKYDKELHNERKSTQKALLEKNMIERESQEKLKVLQYQIQNLTLEVESLNFKLLNGQSALKEAENCKKEQAEKINSQQEDIKNLENQLETLENDLDTSKNTIKHLNKQIQQLESQVRKSRENTSTAAVKNLSYIILSKDSPSKPESSTAQLINKYSESLQELQKADKFSISLIQKCENNQMPKLQKKLYAAKVEIMRRYQKTAENIEELERFVYDCRSPSPISRPSLIEFHEKPFELTESQDKTDDFVPFMKCQAALIEDLLMISEAGNSPLVKFY